MEEKFIRRGEMLQKLLLLASSCCPTLFLFYNPYVDSSCKKPLCICNSTFRILVIWNYFKTVLIWKIFNPNYDFLVPLCLYLVQKYEKNAVANDKCVFATCTEFSCFISIPVYFATCTNIIWQLIVKLSIKPIGYIVMKNWIVSSSQFISLFRLFTWTSILQSKSKCKLNTLRFIVISNLMEENTWFVWHEILT
jgi:hypothetical protein